MSEGPTMSVRHVPVLIVGGEPIMAMAARRHDAEVTETRLRDLTMAV